MLARAHLLLPLAALWGCFFVDSGFGSGPTGDPTEPASLTSQSSSSSSSTADPTTTGAPTSDDATTTDPPTCPSPATCQPGAIEQLGTCDPCGALTRTCQDDCRWGPDTCQQSSESCGHWVFDPLGPGWTHHKPVDGAPTKPVLAAVDLSQHGQLVVFTAGEFQTFTVVGHKWSAPAPIADALPDLPEPILLAFSVWNADGNFYDIAALGAQSAYYYQLTPGNLPAIPTGSFPCCSDWTPDVPDPGLTNVRDIFLDLDNQFGWAQADITALCQLNDPTDLSVYAAWVLPDRVLVQDSSYCFKMVYQTQYTSFAPFAAPGAPPGELVGGTALLGKQLFVFAGD